jgi:hypothetical protein
LLLLPLAGVVLFLSLPVAPAPGCCPAPPLGKPVVNADQTVIIIWDAATKTQHFIRQASFTSAADDFGFLVPSPAPPELNESGNEAFPYLLKLTEPEIQKVPRPRGGLSCGCGMTLSSRLEDGHAVPGQVRVLDEKFVAGFQAAVLEASSAKALIVWLQDNGYSFSPAIEAWAKPYVEANWKITALKVVKDKGAQEQKRVAASALRMTFKTDRPLFPYREPDSQSAAESLGAKRRLLRIYFLAEARYQGELTKEVPWTGQVAWANKLDATVRKKVLELLKLPETTGPAQWFLTEFEDEWPYRKAPADVYFSRDVNQNSVKRPPIIEYVAAPWPTDATVYAIAAAMVLPLLWRRVRRWKE